MEKSTLLASQPIYDRQDRIEAVELLYRNDAGESALSVGEYRATSELLFNLGTSVIDQADHYKCDVYINVSADFLLSGAFLPVDPSRVVIELVERITPTPELIHSVHEWHGKGFRFALDDFDFTEAWRPLLDYASVVKVDLSQFTEEVIVHERSKLQGYPVRWLAERVEEESQRNRFMELGFDLFQGYFMARPKLISGRKLDPAGWQLVRVVSLLYQDEPDFDELTEVLSADPNLSISLIKIVNSPFYRSQARISSIREVVVRLGIDHLRQWSTLISALNASSTEQARLVLVRAGACQALAKRMKNQQIEPSTAFLCGLLSGVDIMMGIEPAMFLQEIKVDEAVQQAITDYQGPLGKLLKLVVDIEQAVALNRGLDRFDYRMLMLYGQSAREVQAQLREIGGSKAGS